MSVTISSSVSIATRRLNDLRTYQLPRLSQCQGPVQLFRDIADEMKGDLEGVRRSIEMSRELAESVEERDQWLDQVDALERDMNGLRAEYRDALVRSKRAINAKARSRHHDLLIERAKGESSDPPLEAQKAKSRVGTNEDDALQTKTNEVTDALRRTTTIMQAELERSVLSVQMLDESTKTLQLTQSLYDNYTSLLTTSTHLVKALERADWYDRLLIFAAFILFLLVVGWVLKRRVLDKVVGGVGWYVGGSWRLLRMGVGSKTKARAAELGAAGTVETVRMVRASGASVPSAASVASSVTKAGSAALESAAGEAAAQVRSVAKEAAGVAGAAGAAAAGMASAASSVVSGHVRDLDKEGRKIKPAVDTIIDEILPSIPAAGSESTTASPNAARDEL